MLQAEHLPRLRADQHSGVLHMQPATFSLAHRHRRHGVSPQPQKPRACHLNVAPGCHLHMEATCQSRVIACVTNPRGMVVEVRHDTAALLRDPVASRPTPCACRLMDIKFIRKLSLVAFLIYAGGTGYALCDLCPAPLMDGTLTIPDTATLKLKASTHGGDATLTGPLGTISGRASVTCQSGDFRAMLYGMSDGSLYRCLGTIDGRRFTGHCVNGGVTGEISGRFLAQP